MEVSPHKNPASSSDTPIPMCPRISSDLAARSWRSETGSSVPRRLSLRQQCLPPLPGVGAGFAVGLAGVGRFAGAHEAVTGAFVGHPLESFAGGFHVLNCLRKSGADARVVSCIEAVHRSRNARHGVF